MNLDLSSVCMESGSTMIQPPSPAPTLMVIRQTLQSHLSTLGYGTANSTATADRDGDKEDNEEGLSITLTSTGYPN